jgi:hypothetical protein
MTPPAEEPTPEVPVEVTGKAEETLVLLTKVGLSKVEVSCTAVKFVGALLEAAGGASGKLHYEGCITKINGSTAGACVPHSPGAANGLIQTNSLKGQLQLHEVSPGTKLGQLELLPQAGSVFVTVVAGKEAPEKNECAFGEKFDVSGTLFADEAGGGLEAEATTHLLKASASLGALKFGANAATLDGGVRLDLPGAVLWSGLGG